VLRSDQDNPNQRHHSVQQIFDRLLTEHHMTAVSYSTVRDYVAHARIWTPRNMSSAAAANLGLIT
jgi:hypothetical protein